LLLSSLLGFDPRGIGTASIKKKNPAALNIVDFKDTVRARLTLFTIPRLQRRLALAIPAVPRRGSFRNGGTRSRRGGDGVVRAGARRE